MRKVFKSYSVTYRDAIRVRKGEAVLILKEETKPQWQGWVWCQARDGQTGWISKEYLEIIQDSAILNCDYDAKEVAVEACEKVHVLKEENGWAWVRKDNNEEGWIPIENLEKI